jgi:hypothetical protein
MWPPSEYTIVNSWLNNQYWDLTENYIINNCKLWLQTHPEHAKNYAVTATFTATDINGKNVAVKLSTGETIKANTSNNGQSFYFVFPTKVRLIIPNSFGCGTFGNDAGNVVSGQSQNKGTYKEASAGATVEVYGIELWK